MTWARCPTCASDWQRSTQLIEGHTVLRCPRCRTYCLQGDGGFVIKQTGLFPDEVTLSDDEVIDQLQDRADRMANEREPNRTMRAMYGPDDDPMWETLP